MSVKTYLSKDKCDEVNKLAKREQEAEAKEREARIAANPMLSGWTKMKFNCYMSNDELESLAEEYVKWAHETDAVRPTTFAISRGVDTDVFLSWRSVCPKLEHAHKAVVAIFAERRERNGLEGKWNPGMIMATMPLYCPAYASWRKEMSASKAAEGQTVKVQIETMPNTSIVAHKGFEGTED